MDFSLRMVGLDWGMEDVLVPEPCKVSSPITMLFIYLAHARSNAIPVDIIDYDHYMLGRRVWHEYRLDLESKLYELTHDEGTKRDQVGNYNRDYFPGQCTEDQSTCYTTSWRVTGDYQTNTRFFSISKAFR